MFEWLKKKFKEDQMETPFSKGEPRAKTKVMIKYNAGFNNNLYIRGHGAGLTWEHGVLLKNVGPDEWVWEITIPFKDCEFKVLINDVKYEQGENHHISSGKSIHYTPRF